jgi:hypothetical protein
MIEHGNQRDAFNTFPDFGNRYGMPSGYFITASTVAAAGRSAQRGRSPWLSDLESVYPNEEIPFWMWSNYFYKEMADPPMVPRPVCALAQRERHHLDWSIIGGSRHPSHGDISRKPG